MEKTIKELFPNVSEPIEKSIKIGDVQYYQFSGVELPPERYYGIAQLNDEWESRVTREFLLGHVTAVENVLNEGKLSKVAVLNAQLKERLNILNDFDTVYKIVAAVTFDENENPNRFDYSHTLKKAKIFKEAKLDDFFFQIPIVKLIHLGQLSTHDLNLCFQVMQKVNKIHLDNIIGNLSEQDKKKEFAKFLMLQKTEDKVWSL